MWRDDLFVFLSFYLVLLLGTAHTKDWITNQRLEMQTEVETEHDGT